MTDTRLGARLPRRDLLTRMPNHHLRNSPQLTVVFFTQTSDCEAAMQPEARCLLLVLFVCIVNLSNIVGGLFKNFRRTQKRMQRYCLFQNPANISRENFIFLLIFNLCKHYDCSIIHIFTKMVYYWQNMSDDIQDLSFAVVSTR